MGVEYCRNVSFNVIVLVRLMVFRQTKQRRVRSLISHVNLEAVDKIDKTLPSHVSI